MRRVLVTGVTGFAGSHLVDYMLERGDCEIFGIQRWRSRTENIEHFADRITLLECDLRDASSTRDTIEKEVLLPLRDPVELFRERQISLRAPLGFGAEAQLCMTRQHVRPRS